MWRSQIWLGKNPYCEPPLEDGKPLFLTTPLVLGSTKRLFHVFMIFYADTSRFLKILHQERPSEVLQVCRLHAFRSLPKRQGKKRPFCCQSSLAAKMAKNHQKFGVKAGKLIDILQSHGFTKVSAFFGVAIFFWETWTTSRRCYFFGDMAMGPNLQLFKITIQSSIV